MAEVQERIFHGAGKVIFKQGDPAEDFYFIENGTVEMWKISGDDKEKVFTLKKGDIFGEMALIDKAPRMFSAIIGAEGATLVCVQANYIEKKIEESHPFIKMLLRRLLDNARKR